MNHSEINGSSFFPYYFLSSYSKFMRGSSEESLSTYFVTKDGLGGNKREEKPGGISSTQENLGYLQFSYNTKSKH